MRILVVGGGGREHALVKALSENARVTDLFCVPGNAGIAEDCTCAPIPVTDLPAIVQFALHERVDLVVVGPDDPLAAGLADMLAAQGVPCFGPTAAAARIESSKSFAKGLMQAHHIPTASYEVFDDLQDALLYLKAVPYPVVLKADGLALGKGVTIAKAYHEAADAARQMLSGERFGKSGRRIVVEAFMKGPEVSLLCLTDGKTILPLVSSMDHKRAEDGDRGPNTGGMGAIAPNPFYTPDVAERVMEEILKPTIAALSEEGCPFVGCLYAGLMLTDEGPKVIEFNCRFGDPEAQVVLPLLKTDFLTLLLATVNGTLDQVQLVLKPDAACCVMVVSGGYPGSYQKELPLRLPPNVEHVTLYHSGTALQHDRLVTAGGRVMGVTAVAPTLSQAVGLAYQSARSVKFDGAFYRKDIGLKALEA